MEHATLLDAVGELVQLFVIESRTDILCDRDRRQWDLLHALSGSAHSLYPRIHRLAPEVATKSPRGCVGLTAGDAVGRCEPSEPADVVNPRIAAIVTFRLSKTPNSERPRGLVGTRPSLTPLPHWTNRIVCGTP